MNLKEALKFLEEFKKKSDDDNDYSLPDWLEMCFSQTYNVDSEYEVKVEEEFGGEGKGSDMWLVVSLTSKDDSSDVTYVKFSGWYDSWAGYEYTDEELVEPQQEVITRWRKV